MDSQVRSSQKKSLQLIFDSKVQRSVESALGVLMMKLELVFSIPYNLIFILCNKGGRRILLVSHSLFFGGQGGWVQTKLSFASKT